RRYSVNAHFALLVATLDPWMKIRGQPRRPTMNLLFDATMRGFDTYVESIRDLLADNVPGGSRRSNELNLAWDTYRLRRARVEELIEGLPVGQFPLGYDEAVDDLAYALFVLNEAIDDAL